MGPLCCYPLLPHIANWLLPMSSESFSTQASMQALPLQCGTKTILSSMCCSQLLLTTNNAGTTTLISQSFIETKQLQWSMRSMIVNQDSVCTNMNACISFTFSVTFEILNTYNRLKPFLNSYQLRGEPTEMCLTLNGHSILTFVCKM